MAVLFLLHMCKSHWNVHGYPATRVLLLNWVTHPWGIRQSLASLVEKLEDKQNRKEKEFENFPPYTSYAYGLLTLS